jgi:preprotein translocase subunit SecB
VLASRQAGLIEEIRRFIRAEGRKTMADEGTEGQNGAKAAPQNAQQNLGVLAQYIKDLSFENPGAPQSLRARSTPPTINIAINVQAGPLSNNEVEVELKIDCQAKTGDATLFAIDLSYAGIFRLTNIPQEAVQPILMIECPRLLFPFARQIIAEASRNGGFPPLLIDPVDFVSLYRQRLSEMQARPRDTVA